MTLAQRASTFIRILALMGSLVLGFTPPAVADTGSRMDAYFSDSLGAANVTGPTAYHGQSMNYFTGGNLSVRTPQKNLQLAGVQMPSISAGCGGIDIFSGGFSFVNSAQLVAEMKAIASGAEGYAFNYALKHLCPSCADVLTQLQDFAQKINSTNIGSCQATNALLNSVFDRTEATNHQMCSELGTGHGYFSDMVQGWAKCQSSSTSNLDQMGTDAKEFVPTKKNLAWEAIKKVPYLSSDPDFSQLVMTLTGTFVENCTTDAPSGCTYTVIQPAANEPHTIAVLLDGGSMAGIQCDDTDVCLQPNPTGRNFTIAPSSGFKAKVTALINDIVTKVIARQPLTTDEQNFLQSTPVPVLKMARIYATSQGVLAQSTLDNYADLIATVSALYFIDESIHQLSAGARNLASVDPEQLRAWTEQTSRLQDSIRSREIGLAQEAAGYESMIDRAQKVEASLAANYGSRFAQSYAFIGQLSGR